MVRVLTLSVIDRVSQKLTRACVVFVVLTCLLEIKLILSIFSYLIVGLNPSWVKSKTEISMCCFFAKQAEFRTSSKDVWLGIRIICESAAICLFKELPLLKSN